MRSLNGWVTAALLFGAVAVWHLTLSALSVRLTRQSSNGSFLQRAEGTALNDPSTKSAESDGVIGKLGPPGDRGWVMKQKQAWFSAGDVPMYYVNLDRSPERRRTFERFFGPGGKLVRIPGVDAQVPGQLEKYIAPPAHWKWWLEVLSGGEGQVHVPTNDATVRREFEEAVAKNDVRAHFYRDGEVKESAPAENVGNLTNSDLGGKSTKSIHTVWAKKMMRRWNATAGEISLCVGHWLAIKEAYKDGSDVALILEDDASPLIIPYWTKTLREVAMQADGDVPNWRVLRLQWHAREEIDYLTLLLRWAADPGILFQSTFAGEGLFFGSVAYLINRQGMRDMLDFYTPEDGNPKRFSCEKVKAKCISDWIMRDVWKGDQEAVQIVFPPMFGVGLFETETGTRGVAKGAPAVGYHEKAVASSMKLAIENFDFQISAESLVEDPEARRRGELTPEGRALAGARRQTVWYHRTPGNSGKNPMSWNTYDLVLKE